ncbi:MAG: tRNA dimethylallyltransferase [Chlamydiae bacterium]|nr:tRNA dimethylallyltransferase [Chlamydiota bacterium]
MSFVTPECQATTLSSPFGTIIPLEKKIKGFPKTKPKKILLIAGPTACGKSALSLLLAKLLHGEVISADSMQVYRGMDIGTVKVSQEDQAAVPHHLLDIRHVQEPFNVVDFYYEARQCCESILSRDRVPLVVGGSGFYFRTLIYGPPEGPPPIPDIRHSLEEEMEELGSLKMFEKLKVLDPNYAKTITSNDRHKIIRAMEIVTLTGKSVSEHKWEQIHPLPDFSHHCWFVYKPREILYPLIDARCEQILEAGFLEEVQELEKAGIRTNPSASQAIGYRQALDFLSTSQDEKANNEFVRKFKTASRHYAKRQFTWFRKEPLFRWLDVDRHDLETAAELIAQDFLSTP